MSDGEVLPAVCGGVVWRSVGEDAVVFTGSGDVVHGLTERGRLVLAACQAGSTVEDVAAEQSWHRSEVIAVVAELAALHLVDPTAATALNGSSSVESSRRAMLQRSAVIGGGVVIASVAAPMVAAHATGDLGTNNPSFYGYVYYIDAQYRGQYYYPVGTQVSGLTPGDVITGFELSQTAGQNYDYGSTTVTFAVIDGDGGLPSGVGSAPAADGVNGVTEPVSFGPSPSTATASGFSHPVPMSGQVIIAAYLPDGASYREFDQVFTGQPSDVLFYGGTSATQSALVFTVYGYTPASPTTKSVHGDRSESARSRDESRAHPAITVLSRQEPLGLPLPPGVPRPGQLDPAKLRRSRRRPG